MARVITFSTKFPGHHPKKRQPTRFVEAIWNSQNTQAFGETFYWPGEDYVKTVNRDLPFATMTQFLYSLLPDRSNIKPKGHTIRAGHRWKVGDKFSPRVWSGRPYNSPMITIGPDMDVKKVWNIEIKQLHDGGLTQYLIFIEGRSIGWSDVERLIVNDGLTYTDFCDWFGLNKRRKKPLHFDGQIICWDDQIEY